MAMVLRDAFFASLLSLAALAALAAADFFASFAAALAALTAFASFSLSSADLGGRPRFFFSGASFVDSLGSAPSASARSFSLSFAAGTAFSFGLTTFGFFSRFGSGALTLVLACR